MADTKPTMNACACGCGRDAGFYKSGNRKEGINRGDPKKYIVGHWNYGRRDTHPCEVDGCDSGRYAKGMCHFHYDRMRWRGTTEDPEGLVMNMGRPCCVEGCDRIEHTKGMCEPHYRRVRDYGDPLIFGPIGKRRDLSVVPDGHAWCVKCDVIKPISEFHKGQKRCKDCWYDWFQENKLEIYEKNRASSRKTYLEAKESGRCAWRGGRGCQTPARKGRVLCGHHAREDSIRVTARVTGRFDDAYLRRGISRCWICGSEFSESNVKHNDHLIPRSLGGPDEPWNMAPACAYCNLSRNNTPLHTTMETAVLGELATSEFPPEYKKYLTA